MWTALEGAFGTERRSRRRGAADVQHARRSRGRGDGVSDPVGYGHRRLRHGPLVHESLTLALH